MAIDRPKFERHIRDFRFKELFNELGWNYVKKEIPLPVNEKSYILNGIAEKQQFIILQCAPRDGDGFPDSNIRKKIDREISKLFLEHLIIFTDSDRTKQIWQLCVRQANKPLITHEVTYYTHQAPEIILQKLSGLLFTLEEEGKIGLVDVVRRVTEVFDRNTEKVTRKFYDQFREEQQTFLKFIDGIDSVVERDWYASLMLNRLMFIYFIQKKGFLDRNENYLRDKLEWSQKRKGKDKFYSFYRDFLLVLFHKGLGNPARNPQLLDEIGEIPYLNGGLFDEHNIEKANNIKIPDNAFENVFNFFDQYNWHLDYRTTATGRDINPDVIGYIFEKYINDRAAMGAYYTKEDITGYISKNTIIPFLFDDVKKQCATAFHEDSSLWKMLDDDPDRYIYDAVKHGVYDENGNLRPLPPEIEIGMDTTKPGLLERRKEWNRKAPAEYGLPTEIWREYIERRRRYFDIRKKITNGEIREINDFITYNMDIKQFAQDAVENYEGSDFIVAFSKAVKKITVMDPTCGSGAFLFAAMNILEPLYETCIKRMREFVEEDDARGGRKYSSFRDTLKTIKKHLNEKYYIFKSIILNNMYGVDIMNEAVEIAKLRLFLKLAATVEVNYQKPNMGLEPLPDLDFNIRCGNTLAGFATKDDIDKVFSETLDLYNTKDKIYDKMDIVAHAYKRFKEMQLADGGMGHANFHKAKDDLEKRLAELNEELNHYLAKEYGKDPENKPNEYEQWKKSHQPFHWLAEFYEIIHDHGGFDVIIGNPPYVEYKDIQSIYIIKSYITHDCSNLFSYVLERNTSFTHDKSIIGMIVPLSAFSTDRMAPLIKLIKEKSSNIYIANFSWRPGKLFDGVNLQLSIILHTIGYSQTDVKTTKYILWESENRSTLFSKIEYSQSSDKRLDGSIPKMGNIYTSSILNKLRLCKSEISNCLYSKSSNKIFYRRGGLYWKVFVDFVTGSSEEKILSIHPEIDSYSIIAILSSNIWLWYFTSTSDCRHLGNRDINTFPFDPRELSSDLYKKISKIGRIYVADLKKNAQNTTRVYKAKKAVECLSFRVKLSKPIIDEIDKVLAEHYGFTEEELDFIINYDIKYRMGGELEKVYAGEDV